MCLITQTNFILQFFKRTSFDNKDIWSYLMRFAHILFIYLMSSVSICSGEGCKKALQEKVCPNFGLFVYLYFICINMYIKTNTHINEIPSADCNTMTISFAKVIIFFTWNYLFFGVKRTTLVLRRHQFVNHRKSCWPGDRVAGNLIRCWQNRDRCSSQTNPYAHAAVRLFH